MNTLSFTRLFNHKKKQDILLILFVLFGVALRLFHFFYNRSLWMDEVYLSTSLINYDYLELIKTPLLYQQKAPLAFLISVKLMVNLFGNNEYALRLIPLISGILAMLIFIPVSRFFLNQKQALIAVGILSFAPALIYHSVEIKQYETELLGTLLCLFLWIKFRDNHRPKQLVLLGLCGAIILWFSYSSIFILAGIGIANGLQAILAKDWKSFLASLIPGAIWLMSFLINYLLFTHKHAESEWIAYWFRSYHNFMPLPPKSVDDLKWFPLSLYRMMDYPLGLLWNFSGINYHKTIGILLKFPILPIGLFLAGIYTFLKGKKILFFILCLPVLLTFLASGLELYPLTERFWVFISPIFIIIIVKGLSLAQKKSLFLYYLLACLLLVGPVVQSASYVIYPDGFYVHKKSFQREALTFVNTNYREGDMVYVYWNNLPGYRLYKELYKFKYNAVEGTDYRKLAKNQESYIQYLNQDIKKLKDARRIWIIVNNMYLTDIGDQIDEPTWYYKSLPPTNYLLQAFSKLGIPVIKKTTADISIYLIERKD